MNHPKAEKSILPDEEVTPGQTIVISDPIVNSLSGLYRLWFSQKEFPGNPVDFTREKWDEIRFVIPSYYTQPTTVTVTGRYAPDSPVDESDRTFGELKVKP